MSVREVISFFYPDSKARLAELVVDAFLHERHTFASVMTEHPVESGSVIVDHIHNQPFSLDIEGIISNTPMSLVGLTAFDSAKRYIEGGSNDFAMLALEEIEKIFIKREPITIATSLKTYNKMVLETLSIERGGGFYSESLHFSCTAKQIHQVDQKHIKIPKPKTSRATPIEKKGLQETKIAPKEMQEAVIKKKSWVKGVFGDATLDFSKIHVEF